MTSSGGRGFKSRILMRLVHRFPGIARAVLLASLRGYLPLAIYYHWFSKEIERELWPSGRPWVGKVLPLMKNLEIEADVGDYIGRKIFEEGCYEPETVSFLHKQLKQGMTFIDVGANIGQYSLIASRLVGPRGKVVCFEPNPFVFSVLQRNLARNRCANVIANNIALGSANGQQELFLSDARSLGTTSLSPSADHYSGQSVNVQVNTLDEFIESKSIQQVDMIKIDVEGAEAQVLSGAVNTLSSNKDILIVLEINEMAAARFGSSTKRLTELLGSLAFNTFLEDGSHWDSKRAPKGMYFNVVASRKSNLNQGAAEKEPISGDDKVENQMGYASRRE